MKYQSKEYLERMARRYDDNPEKATRDRMEDMRFGLTWFAGERLGEERIGEIISTLKEWGFFDAPGSTKYHDNYPGGLYEHSDRVAHALVVLTQKLNLQWEDPSSPYLVGILHDVCKSDSYIRQDDGTFRWNDNQTLDGHGDKSVVLITMLGISLTEEEIHCIRWHMGAYEGESCWNTLGRAIEEYPNVLYTHLADMIDSKDIHESLPDLPVYWTSETD